MEDLIALKWNKLLRRSKIFILVPFVEIVFAAGSMAMGSANKDSDFDVIVGVKTGRIFTARFFCFLFFGILGWRRKKYSRHSHYIRNKFCFSHFVAPEKYRLSEPHNKYWKKLYLSIIPIYGNSGQIQKFYDANADWVGSVRHCECDRSPACRQAGIYPFKRLPHSFQSLAMTEKRQAESVFEKMLSGKFGNVLEKWLKLIQIKKIEKSPNTVKQYKPRVVFNDSELEFHPDTRRIEEMLNKKEF